MKLYGVTGRKDAGKTTLVAALVEEIAGRGLTVSTLKHAHHGVDFDQPGRDTFRHRSAGAREVILATPARWALMSELRGEPEPPMEALLAKLAPVDLVLVEGWKDGAHPKIEVWREGLSQPPLALERPAIRAVAALGAPPKLTQRVLPLDDPAAVADFILAELDLA
jgi:molybdopterin-guanine dinucleotide biosynthesis protein MobB